MDWDPDRVMEIAFAPCYTGWFQLRKECDLGECENNRPPSVPVAPALPAPYIPFRPLPDPVQQPPPSPIDPGLIPLLPPNMRDFLRPWKWIFW